MFRFVILFCAVLAFAAGQTNISRCSFHNGPLPVSAHIQGCTTPPCRLPQGRDAVINVHFRAPHNIRRMTSAATAFLGNIPVPHNLGNNANTCNFLQNASCPVSRNQDIRFVLRMFIERSYPVGTQLPVEFRVLDDNNSAVMCLRVTIRVDPARVANAVEDVDPALIDFN